MTIYRGFKGKLVLPFSQDLDADKIHVQAPKSVIFLCGGQTTSIAEPKPISLRDAFLKILNFAELDGREIVQAEDVTSSVSFFSKYDNLLDFETHLAQIVELIVLFCESEGSLAELGGFVLIDEIALRLFVVVQEQHWNQESFIKLGPLKYLENRYGRDFIFVVDESEVGIRGKDYGAVDVGALKNALAAPLSKRLDRPREPSTFDEKRPGHIIKLIVGLVQEYGALQSEELINLLQKLGVNSVTEETIGQYILCAEAVGWVKIISKGFNDYIAAVETGQDAATLHFKPTAPERNKGRRRIMIREHWKANDRPRFNAIVQASGAVRS